MDDERLEKILSAVPAPEGMYALFYKEDSDTDVDIKPVVMICRIAAWSEEHKQFEHYLAGYGGEYLDNLELEDNFAGYVYLQDIPYERLCADHILQAKKHKELDEEFTETAKQVREQIQAIKDGKVPPMKIDFSEAFKSLKGIRIAKPKEPEEGEEG